MKNFALAVVVLFGFSLTANATLECRGTEKDSNVFMSILDLATRQVREGQKNPVAMRVTENVQNAKGYTEEKVLFAGVVQGSTEDVMWFLKSNDRKKTINDTIYLDDAEQNITVGDREIQFNCEIFTPEAQ